MYKIELYKLFYLKCLHLQNTYWYILSYRILDVMLPFFSLSFVTSRWIIPLQFPLLIFNTNFENVVNLTGIKWGTWGRFLTEMLQIRHLYFKEERGGCGHCECHILWHYCGERFVCLPGGPQAVAGLAFSHLLTSSATDFRSSYLDVDPTLT